MNWGWYTVYIIMIVVNTIVCHINNFDMTTWQFWVYSVSMMMCFIAGSYYRKKED